MVTNAQPRTLKAVVNDQLNEIYDVAALLTAIVDRVGGNDETLRLAEMAKEKSMVAAAALFEAS